MGWRDTIKEEDAEPSGWRSTIQEEAPQGPQGSMTEAPLPEEPIRPQPRGEPMLDLSGALDPESYAAFFRNVDIPVVTPLGTALGERVRALGGDGDYASNLARIQSEREAKRQSDVKNYPRSVAAGGIVGGLGFPTPAKGVPKGGPMMGPATEAMTGAGGAAARIGEQAAIGSADAKLRGEDPLTAAGVGGGMAGLGELARIKTMNRTLLGVPDQMQDYYLKNRAGVNSARETPEIASELYSKREDLADAVSQGSGESYGILKNSGYEMPLERVNAAIDEAAETIRAGGAYDGASQRLLNELNQIQARVAADASLGPAAYVEANRIKSLITQMRNAGKSYAKGGDGVAQGMAYNKGAVDRGASAIDQELKTAVPEYRTKMEDVARKTEAFKGVAGRLSDETRTQQAVRRMMLGKDPEALKALKEFDEVAGTGYAKELQDSAVKESFSRDRTRGSARTNLGALIGAATGAVAGKGDPIVAGVLGAAGGALGRGADVYAGKAAKALLDLSQTPYLGRAAQMLNTAARRGPQAMLATHRWLMENDKAYQAKIDALKEGEAP